ncbi:DUF3221 domain-containing protein [Paenibacillus sp.]|uniref:DUF3221 domain-containing protein n=1 Tax=Paenibacillus sp. TaxID=58172 RepID=UPI002D4EACAC|nr:DUF3221 domain-containing protein [Paenibacillus sp.]HZG57247.1 DUF3221 domain-containing protein [Paenibacillus sp.]
MKKVLASSLLFLFMLAPTASSAADSYDDMGLPPTLKVYINGEEYDPGEDGKFLTMIYKGSTYMPVRHLSRMLGVDRMGWDGEKKWIWVNSEKPATGARSEVSENDTSVMIIKVTASPHIATVTFDPSVRLFVNGTEDRSGENGLIHNGLVEVPKAIFYEGTAYVPLRYFATRFGVPNENISWNHGKVTVLYNPDVEQDLAALQDKLLNNVKEVQDDNGIVILSGGVFNESLEVDFRTYGEHEVRLGPDELSAIRNSIYRIVGATFPLKLNQVVIREEADIEGIIRQIDEASGRLLIENPNRYAGDTELPEAVWISLTEDATVKYLEHAQRLEVGQRARVWFVGTMLLSYPGQTAAVKLEILG